MSQVSIIKLTLRCGVNLIKSHFTLLIVHSRHWNHEEARIVRQDFQEYSHLRNYNQKYCTDLHHNSDVLVIFRHHIRLFDIHMYSIVHRMIELWILHQNRNNVAMGQIREYINKNKKKEVLEIKMKKISYLKNSTRIV